MILKNLMISTVFMWGMHLSVQAQTMVLAADKANDAFCPDLITGSGSGNSLANAAPSCRTILGLNPSATDGVYFLDIDGPSGPELPFRGYCDMTTDGGGWWLIHKSQYTTRGPTKIEMTGDITLAGGGVDFDDPWNATDPSPGRIPDSADLTAFTSPTSPDYFPVGYKGDLLQDQNLFTTSETNDRYAIVSRNLIDLYRNGPCYSVANNTNSDPSDDDNASVMRHSQYVSFSPYKHYYIQSEKRFNPIQQKCNDNVGTCDYTNVPASLSGCSPRMILSDDIFTNYDAVTHVPSVNMPSANWTLECSHTNSNGADILSVNPAAFFGGDSNVIEADKISFYDLSRTGGSTSGPVHYSARTNLLYAYASSSSYSKFTMLWLK